jgi:hypothetical protein
MDTSVDAAVNGNGYEFSLKRNWWTQVYAWWPQDIGQNQWFRLAPSYGSENGWDCILQILNEGIYIDKNNGTPKAWITVQNNTPAQTFQNTVEFFGLLDIVINVLSAPSNY